MASGYLSELAAQCFFSYYVRIAARVLHLRAFITKTLINAANTVNGVGPEGSPTVHLLDPQVLRLQVLLVSDYIEPLVDCWA